MKIDKALIQSCVESDRRAQNQLYKKCFGILMGVCMRYEREREEAEELLNQAFLKILRNIDKYDYKAPFEAWIRRIMINTIIDNYRKYKKDKENLQYSAMDTDWKDVGISLNDAYLEFEAEELENMLKKLPDMSRKVFNLFAIEGFSHKEIGDMLGLSDGTSKWHVSVARARLKELIYEKLNEKRSIKND